jgi:hypothetical protein
LTRAQDSGCNVRRQDWEVAATASPRALALLAPAALNALAIRARAGIAERELRELADAAVDAICR